MKTIFAALCEIEDPEVRAKALANTPIKTQHELIEDRHGSLYALDQAFDWEDSPEGRVYWMSKSKDMHLKQCNLFTWKIGLKN